MTRFLFRVSTTLVLTLMALLLIWHAIAPALGGQMIGYVSNRRDGGDGWSIQLIDLRTRYALPLPAQQYSPATFDWSPDCEQMVFIGTVQDGSSVYLFNWRTLESEPLLENEDFVAYVYPRWSPDGDSILMIRSRSAPESRPVRELVLFNLEDRTIRTLVNELQGGIFPAWAPNGEKIVYLKTGRVPDLFEFDVETGEENQLTFGRGSELSPVYSPDGKYIAYSQEARGRSNIFVMEIATGDTEMVSRDFSNAISPTWSPDGKQIAFARGSGSWVNNIFVADLETGTEFQLTNHREWTLFPQWSPCH